MVELALVLAWIVIAIGGWLVYQMLAEIGRLLLRVEELERQVGQLAPVAAVPAADAVTTDEARTVGVPAGTVLHDFDLPDAHGQRVTLSALAEKRLLLIFVSPECEHSRTLLRALAA